MPHWWLETRHLGYFRWTTAGPPADAQPSGVSEEQTSLLQCHWADACGWSSLGATAYRRLTATAWGHTSHCLQLSDGNFLLHMSCVSLRKLGCNDQRKFSVIFIASSQLCSCRLLPWFTWVANSHYLRFFSIFRIWFIYYIATKN